MIRWAADKLSGIFGGRAREAPAPSGPPDFLPFMIETARLVAAEHARRAAERTQNHGALNLDSREDLAMRDPHSVLFRLKRFGEALAAESRKPDSAIALTTEQAIVRVGNALREKYGLPAVRDVCCFEGDAMAINPVNIDRTLNIVGQGDGRRSAVRVSPHQGFILQQ